MHLLLFLLLLLIPAHAENLEDPYAWLEDVTGERSMAWVATQNQKSTSTLQTKDYAALHQRLRSILDSNDRIPYVQKMGDFYYNFWKDAQHERGLWRRTTLAEYEKPNPAWETVLDLDALDAAEGVPWVWHGANCLEPAYVRCMIGLSRGGSDADTKREFDLRTKSFVADGFVVPEAKSQVNWLDADTLFVMTDLGPGTTTTSGYPRQVRTWKRGAPLAEAPVLYTGAETDLSVGAYRDHAPGFERTFITHNISFFTGEMIELRPDGSLVKIDTPDDAGSWAYHDWLFVTLRSDWTTGGKTWPAGALLVAKYDAFMAGDRNLEALFTPTPTTALADIALTPDALVLGTLDNVRSKVSILRPTAEGWVKTPMTGLPEYGSVSVSAVDPDLSDELWITTTDFLTPTTLSLGSAKDGSLRQLKALPPMFDASGLEITQHTATSKDGTKIPYFQVSKKGLKLNGKNPTLLNGYGGFEVSETPFYSGTFGAAWFEKGGVYVLANIRGGGEFGPTWHTSALKENRHLVYEDFAAVAQDLIARKVTRPKQLGALGGSNGGLLVGNMLTQYPKLFGAIVCQVPLLDMKRYSHLLAGASWMDEYGDPDDPAQWAFIQTFSPYHLAQPDQKYPPVLFLTSTRDDRVHPGHARKMAAKMSDQGKKVLYWENTEGGHGGASTSEQTATMWALSWMFLWRELD